MSEIGFALLCLSLILFACWPKTLVCPLDRADARAAWVLSCVETSSRSPHDIPDCTAASEEIFCTRGGKP